MSGRKSSTLLAQETKADTPQLPLPASNRVRKQSYCEVTLLNSFLTDNNINTINNDNTCNFTGAAEKPKQHRFAKDVNFGYSSCKIREEKQYISGTKRRVLIKNKSDPVQVQNFLSVDKKDQLLKLRKTSANCETKPKLIYQPSLPTKFSQTFRLFSNKSKVNKTISHPDRLNPCLNPPISVKKHSTHCPVSICIDSAESEVYSYSSDKLAQQNFPRNYSTDDTREPRNPSYEREREREGQVIPSRYLTLSRVQSSGFSRKESLGVPTQRHSVAGPPKGTAKGTGEHFIWVVKVILA